MSLIISEGCSLKFHILHSSLWLITFIIASSTSRTPEPLLDYEISHILMIAPYKTDLREQFHFSRNIENGKIWYLHEIFHRFKFISMFQIKIRKESM